MSHSLEFESKKMASKSIVILRRQHVLKKLGISNASLYLKLNKSSRYFDPSFPRQIQLGAERKMGSAVGWIESEIETWIQSRMEIRGEN